MRSELNVGLIGYGFAGRAFHAPVITSVSGLKLKKVVERRSERSKERYPWVEIVRDASDLYDDPNIDVIVVTTPSTDHYQFVHDALSAGKHVVVEKPFTTTVEEADELMELAKKKELVLSVFHNRRWDGDFQTIREIVRKELIGEVMECEIHWHGFNPKVSNNWRDKKGQGTGVLYDLGVHLLDQAVCLFGMPKTIFADIQIQREGGLSHDYFDVTLGYGSKLKVSLKSSRFVLNHGPRYILHGDKGSFVKYGLDPQEEALIEGKTPAASSGWGEEPQEMWGNLDTHIGDLHFTGALETIPGAYQDYYQNIYDHIKGLSDLEVKPEEARMNIRLIELALQSHKEGRMILVTR
ncbi:oxidoreductase [Lederbergia lenta]|uniref:Oxidoreductase family protein n=1 Tax=Lederbergia lenta TaxID=1467 RepID=A0A2X4ZSW0_LEDLE|nr:oxidoreductase [Lederbergia lenta]MEC2323417.1 oxidoreductase [Lederbergia lenta]SQI63384.1 oxidoreductase family protein [Lederbergia lenta]